MQEKEDEKIETKNEGKKAERIFHGEKLKVDTYSNQTTRLDQRDKLQRGYGVFVVCDVVCVFVVCDVLCVFVVCDELCVFVVRDGVCVCGV